MMKLSRLILFCLLPILIGFSLFGQSGAQKPNIVFIFIDDQGYYDLSCYGATEINTPRIDAMAKEGIRFTDYYAAAPICSPSRNSFMLPSGFIVTTT